MSYRQHIGARRWTADFQEHSGTVDTSGTPTYDDDGQWTNVITGWPCELQSTAGGEKVRGRQVTAETTHVLFGEYFGAEGVNASMRMILDGQTYNVVSAYDPNGDRREMRVEARIEG